MVPKRLRGRRKRRMTKEEFKQAVERVMMLQRLQDADLKRRTGL